MNFLYTPTNNQQPINAKNMDAIFKKLNYKAAPEIVVLNAPPSFQPNLAAMTGLAAIQTELNAAGPVEFFLAFVIKQEEVDRFAQALGPKLAGDSVIWFAYPKGSSKRYTCEFNRDTGWAVLGQLGLEPVRQVAIDEDWSALRFRKVEHIKKITRRESFALTKQAKQRTTKKGE